VVVVVFVVTLGSSIIQICLRMSAFLTTSAENFRCIRYIKNGQDRGSPNKLIRYEFGHILLNIFY